MITFLVCLALLVGAYFIYGRYLERLVGIDPAAETPCHRCYDGVDYVPLPRWRIFLIQLLNIAGLGPIFGAVLGAAYGPVAFLWITFGGIFTRGDARLRGRGHLLAARRGEPSRVGRALPRPRHPPLHAALLGGTHGPCRGGLPLAARVADRQPARHPGTRRGGLRRILVADAPRAGRDPALLCCGHAAARRQDHRAHLSRVRRRAALHGPGRPLRAALQRALHHSRVHVVRELPDRRPRVPDRADALHNDRLRRHFGLPCHAVAPDGPLHAQRGREPFGLLRCDDLRVDRCPDLGRHRHGLLGRRCGAERRHRPVRRAGGHPHRPDRHRDARSRAGRLRHLRRRGLRHHLRRYGLPFGTSDRRRLPRHRAALAAQAHLDQPAALRRGARHHLRPAVPGHVELLRLDEPDAGRRDALDDRRLLRPAGPRGGRGADPRPHHDLRLCQLYLRLTAHVRHAQPRGSLCAGRGADAGHARVAIIIKLRRDHAKGNA